jgi:hypothetical protein
MIYIGWAINYGFAVNREALLHAVTHISIFLCAFKSLFSLVSVTILVMPSFRLKKPSVVISHSYD